MPETLELSTEVAGLLRKALELDEFFPNMRAADIRSFFPKSALHRYAKQDFVIREGETSRDVYVVVQGRVMITHKSDKACGLLAALGSLAFRPAFEPTPVAPKPYPVCTHVGAKPLPRPDALEPLSAFLVGADHLPQV